MISTPLLPQPEFPIEVPASPQQQPTYQHQQHNRYGYTGNMNSMHMSELNGPSTRSQRVSFAHPDMYYTAEEAEDIAMSRNSRSSKSTPRFNEDRFETLWDTMNYVVQRIQQMEATKQQPSSDSIPASHAIPTPQDPNLTAFVDEEAYKEAISWSTIIPKEQDRSVTTSLEKIIFTHATPTLNVLNWFYQIERVFTRYEMNKVHWFKYTERALDYPAIRVHRSIN